MNHKRKRTNKDVMCERFYCDRYGDRYCCYHCVKQCKNKCLNNPIKCGLVEKTKSLNQA